MPWGWIPPFLMPTFSRPNNTNTPRRVAPEKKEDRNMVSPSTKDKLYDSTPQGSAHESTDEPKSASELFQELVECAILSLGILAVVYACLYGNFKQYLDFTP